MYSVELYRRLQETEHAPGWVECGGIRLASPERMEEIRRQIRLGHGVRAAIARDLAGRGAGGAVPAARHRRRGGRRLPRLRRLPRPVAGCNALANAARGNGLRVHPHPGDRHRRRARRVAGAHRPRDDRLRDGRQLRRHVRGGDRAASRRAPPAGADVAPVRRDGGVPEWPRRDRAASADAARPGPARLLPAGGGRAGDGRLRAQRGAVDRRRAVVRRDPGRLQRPAAPGRWDRFEEITANSQVRVPAMADAGLRKIINGPEAFTPDNEFARETTASSSPLDSARTASRARAASAR